MTQGINTIGYLWRKKGTELMGVKVRTKYLTDHTIDYPV